MEIEVRTGVRVAVCTGVRVEDRRRECGDASEGVNGGLNGGVNGGVNGDKNAEE